MCQQAATRQRGGLQQQREDPVFEPVRAWAQPPVHHPAFIDGRRALPGDAGL
jgi:hypothetical protein